ncbi:MAG: potassium transporter KefB [Deltaproteobacteria bacterium]|nr:potassium transporter KefB [Deltaproteobacteria bacterium]
MQIPLLSDIVIIFAMAIGVLFVCHHLKIPTIVGFLLTGMLAGPHGLALIGAVHEVEILAEIGVVLLLFTIGLEFSMKHLWELRRSVLLGGTFQVVATLLVTFFVARHLGQGIEKSVFLGFLVSLSSTAILLKVLQERAEVDSPQGRISLAVLIFQDVMAVPMMLMIPLMAGAKEEIGGVFFLLFLKGFAVVLLALASARWLVSPLLYQIARTRSRELFLITVVVLCLAVAWLTSSIGLSLALGAFLAGLIISESEYSYQALSSLLPFRDLFTSIFFISIGMLVDIHVLLDHPVLVLLIVLGVITLKALIAAGAAAILGYPMRTMILAGLALSQIGEFSFILSKAGVQFGLLSHDAYQIFLAVSVLTMAATPLIIAGGPSAVSLLMSLPMPGRLRTGFYPMNPRNASPLEAGANGVMVKEHLVIIGYGVNGRNVARAARNAGIPYLIVETNPVTVKKEKAKGEPIIYGDASHEAVLEHAGIHRAAVMVVGIPDPVATRMVVSSARNLNPRLHIITRTRFLQEMKPLYDLGANEVIPEEFETSVEIFSRVLARYLIPKEEIERFVAEVRNDGYSMLRKLSDEATSFCTTSFCDYRLYLPNAEICSLRVHEGAPIANRSLKEVGLRKHHGVTLLSLRRDTEIISNPSAETVVLPGDISVLVGSPEHLAEVRSLFEQGQ